MTRKRSRLKSQLRHVSTVTRALAAGAWATVCFAAPGDLDTSFGIGGVASLEFPPGSALSFNAIALQPAGKLLLAGALDEDMLVVRLTSSGAPELGAFLQQPNGALLAVGKVNVSQLLERDDNIVVRRLT